MVFFAEKKAEDFLEKHGFSIIKRKFVKRKSQIKNALVGFKFPVVMKVAGNKIVHKSYLNGVKLGIKTYSEALHEFEKLLKIRGANGVLIQESLKGKEIFFGIKKNPEFGYVILFGTGGTNVENSKDVAFRVLPLNKDEIRTMVKETAVGKKLSKSELFNVEENLLKLCGLIEKFPNIYELDINPIFIKNKKSYIADARIVFV